MLESIDSVDVVMEASSGLDFLKEVENIELDMIVIDQSMPDCTGLEVIRSLRLNDGKCNSPSVILLTASASSAILKEALKLGANGLVAKRGTGEEVLLAVNAVRAGKQFISPDFDALLQSRSDLDSLTEREMQVLLAILAGNTTRVIAEQLSVSFKTAETHRGRIMQKLDIHTLPELIQFGHDNGLIGEA